MRPVLIAGPTAAGKSALAAALAARLGGVIVNADSQQVYREWRILTARPSSEEAEAVPHLLYGHVGVAERYSVGRWLGEVRPLLIGHSVPVIVGGTGLYFTALTEGLAPIPEVPAAIRAAGEAELARIGLARFATALAARDPDTAAALDLSNPRRVLRAWEVLEATDAGLAAWKARTPAPLLPLGACTAVALEPPRPWLHARCDARLDTMLAGGALDEVARVMRMDLPPDAPGLKAVGAAELALHVSGTLTLAEAAARAKAATRRYAKRQLTWMRNRMATWTRLDPSVPGAADRAIALAFGHGPDTAMPG